MECRLATGRTHQIRVHFAENGHPLVGDPVYGRKTQSRSIEFSDNVKGFINQFDRQALHAWKIGFNHPVSKVFLSFQSELPADMTTLLAAFREGTQI